MKKFIYTGMAMMLAISMIGMPEVKADEPDCIGVGEVMVSDQYDPSTGIRTTVWHNGCTGATTEREQLYTTMQATLAFVE